MDLAFDIYQTTRNFLERGGDVLLIISGVVVYSSAGNAYANNSPL